MTSRGKVFSLPTLHPARAYAANWESIVSAIGLLDEGGKKRLAARCDALLSHSAVRCDEQQRVGVVKILVAAGPHGLPLLRKWPSRESGKAIGELHFSIFCFLDRFWEFDHAMHMIPSVLDLVEKYLLYSASERARATWMAGDMLGDHVPAADGVPVLIRVAQKARFAAGRLAALHGFAHALPRVDGGMAGEIVRVLRNLATNDRSERVRRYAGSLLREEHAICCR